MRTVSKYTNVFLAVWAATVCANAQGTAAVAQAHPPRPGSINFIEGQASINGAAINPSAVGALELDRGQVLTTEAGKVEMLLAPGIFLRLADRGAIEMVSPELVNTEVQLTKGRAMVEAIDVRKEQRIRIRMNGASVLLLKKGLYDLDAEHAEVRVFDGSAEVSSGSRTVKLGQHRKTSLTGTQLKSSSFEPRQYEDDLYRWSGLRSGYLSEASIDIARGYVGAGPEWYGPGWHGIGWYWSPWYGAYTFLPPDRIYYGPFGWGYYSPISVYWSPFIFYQNSPHRFGEFHPPYGHGYPRPRVGPGRGGVGRGR